jgi:hypothetical protein
MADTVGPGSPKRDESKTHQLAATKPSQDVSPKTRTQAGMRNLGRAA